MSSPLLPEVIDASRFGVFNNGPRSPLYWGMWGLMTVEAIVFASLLSSYFYLYLGAGEWPPAGAKAPDLLLPTVNTAVLLASAWFVHKADSGIRRGDERWLKLGLGIGVVLALVFLGVKVYEYGHLSYRWNSHAYGSIVWTVTGFHSAHVVGLVLKTVVVEILAFRHYFTRERNLGVQVNGLYWNFVVAVWIPIYAVLYLAPHVLD